MSASTLFRQSISAYQLNEKELSFQGKSFVVTGGSGYFGQTLVNDLIQKGADLIRIFDVHPPREKQTKVEFHQGSVTQVEQLESCFQGMDGCFHIASFGMSGREMLSGHTFIHQVNVIGTENVLRVCERSPTIQCLVYTSTANVVFCGDRKLEGCDETLDYADPSYHSDDYSKTKTIAERLVVTCGKQARSDPNARIFTCAIRPGGIYGPGETRHIPRLLNVMKMGLLQFTVGGLDSKVDWTYVDNLVFAHELAMNKMLSHATHGKPPDDPWISGEAYFISDEHPINQYEFFRPLVEALGFQMPTIHLPVKFVYIIAYLTECLHRMTARFYNWQPLLTRSEVKKVSITHYFSSAKARAHFGYSPLVRFEEGMRRTVDYTKRIYGKEMKQARIKQKKRWRVFTLGLGLLLAFSVIVYVGFHILVFMF